MPDQAVLLVAGLQAYSDGVGSLGFKNILDSNRRRKLAWSIVAGSSSISGMSIGSIGAGGGQLSDLCQTDDSCFGRAQPPKQTSAISR